MGGEGLGGVGGAQRWASALRTYDPLRLPTGFAIGNTDMER